MDFCAGVPLVRRKRRRRGPLQSERACVFSATHIDAAAGSRLAAGLPPRQQDCPRRATVRLDLARPQASCRSWTPMIRSHYGAAAADPLAPPPQVRKKRCAAQFCPRPSNVTTLIQVTVIAFAVLLGKSDSRQSVVPFTFSQ